MRIRNTICNEMYLSGMLVFVFKNFLWSVVSSIQFRKQKQALQIATFFLTLRRRVFWERGEKLILHRYILFTGTYCTALLWKDPAQLDRLILLHNNARFVCTCIRWSHVPYVDRYRMWEVCRADMCAYLKIQALCRERGGYFALLRATPFLLPSPLPRPPDPPLAEGERFLY